MTDESRMSQSLYAALNVIVGREEEVYIRRTYTTLRDEVYRSVAELKNSDLLPYYSGSRAEGIRFTHSDEDWMFVYRHIKVVPFDSFASLYDYNTSLLLMENEITRPGFTLLRVLDNSNDIRILAQQSPIVSLLNGCYVSSKLWRELHTEANPNHVVTHGPCTSGKIDNFEYDWAYSLQCDSWPVNARQSIHRLHQSVWLDQTTVRNIIDDGVLFVAIGAKKSFFEDTEWRMSFSLSEKRLIQSMNHTQFLCYGLLKLFLKEAIDIHRDVKGLLCSYFMKTVLLWEITTSQTQWNPSSLLRLFWNCVQRLLQWIKCSYCPNFFIPENNMFEGKIEGARRIRLLKRMITLYNEGYICLLRCPSFAREMSRIINSRTRVLEEHSLSIIHVALGTVLSTNLRKYFL